MTAGGKRKGAGRPPLSPQDVPEAITIKAHPSAVARFKAWCAAKKLSHREAFENWARRLKPEHQDQQRGDENGLTL
jgi:hypothetical protein